MKTKFIAIAALALATAFTSCNKNEESNPSAISSLKVTLPENVISRAVDNQVPTATATALGDVAVFLLNGNSVVTASTFTAPEITAKSKVFEQVSSTVNKVIVVANIPAADQAVIAAYTTAAAIKNYAYTIASQNTGTGVVGKTLYGETSTLTVGTPIDAHDMKVAAITLDALTARIEVGAVKAGTGIASVELVGVWVNNYYTNGAKSATQLSAFNATCWNVTPTTNMASATAIGAVTIPAYTEASYYDAADNAQVTLAAGSKAYAYQTFAGNIPHVIMLVKGEFAAGHHDGTNKYFLGYVTFTKFRDNSTTNLITAMDANKIYKVGVGATGVVINATEITPDPEMSMFDLTVNVTVTDWTEVNVTPEP